MSHTFLPPHNLEKGEPGGSFELPSWDVLWAGDREPGGSFELPSWEVLWLSASLAGSFELPSWEVLWLSASLTGTGCDNSVL
jgi:hypothetical protein